MKTVIDTLCEAFLGIVSTKKTDSLPSRVVAAIKQNDNLSEVVVRVIQLVVFSAWAILYFSAPQPDPSTLSQFPAVISAYLIVTFVGLIWACYQHIPNWAIYASILFDISLLIFLIWSFHIQYEQPASFSLKAPAMLNLFILIGLRALRFESRFVLTAGLAAISGWAILVGYVVYNDPADPMVTRDYVTYLTSNTVLIGAEIAKLFTLLFFTIILAIAVRRGHNLLVTSISEQSAADDLSRFFDSSVAEQIRGADVKISAGEGIKRHAAILNIDIRGFTELVGGHQPQFAMSLLSAYQSRLVPIVQRNNGTIDKFMGDGIMITFGASFDSQTCCCDAIKTVDDVLAEVKTWADENGALKNLSGKKVNMAVASGPIIFGAVGDAGRLEYTVIGEPVNLSAKLEKHNKNLKTVALATKETYENAVRQGYSADVEPKLVTTKIIGTARKRDCVILAQ